MANQSEPEAVDSIFYAGLPSQFFESCRPDDGLLTRVDEIAWFIHLSIASNDSAESDQEPIHIGRDVMRRFEPLAELGVELVSIGHKLAALLETETIQAYVAALRKLLTIATETVSIAVELAFIELLAPQLARRFAQGAYRLDASTHQLYLSSTTRPDLGDFWLHRQLRRDDSVNHRRLEARWHLFSLLYPLQAYGAETPFILPFGDREYVSHIYALGFTPLPRDHSLSGASANATPLTHLRRLTPREIWARGVRGVKRSKLI